MRHPHLSRVLIATVVAAAAGCADISAPTAVSRGNSQAALGDDAPPAVMMLCKVGPAGTNATFSVSATGGELRAGSSVTLNATTPEQDYDCTEIWRATSLTEVSTITVAETAASLGTQLELIAWFTELDGWGEGDVATKTAIVRADWRNSGIIWFKNIAVDVPPPPPPPTGLAGCTPGFWRQAHHYAYWTSPYTPTTAFGAVFADAFPGQTLGQVVQQGGGGLNALGRHTVAALLNAASPEVNYGMTPAQVIAGFNAAVASGNYDAQKLIFESANERGCTVDKSNDGGSPAGKGKKK